MVQSARFRYSTKTSQAEPASGLCIPAFALAEAERRSTVHRPPESKVPNLYLEPQARAFTGLAVTPRLMLSKTVQRAVSAGAMLRNGRGQMYSRAEYRHRIHGGLASIKVL